MRFLISVLFFLVVLSSLEGQVESQRLIREEEPFHVIAYLPEWRYEGIHYETAFEVVTHLIFFSLEVTAEGQLAARDRLPRAALLQEAREAADRHGGKLLICVGGNGRSAGFPGLVQSAAARQRFIEELVALLQEQGFDGVDLNWEYPGYAFGHGYSAADAVTRDYQGLGMLLQEMRQAFSAAGKLITLAYYPDEKQEQWLAQIKAADDVDFMHMMAYDQPGRHSTLVFAKKSIDQALATWSKQELRKVTLGLPFYGRSQSTGDWQSYEDIVNQHTASGSSPLTLKDDASNMFFNSPKTIRQKTKYAKEVGLGGVMIWELGQDCRLTAIARADGSSHPQTCPRGKEDSLLYAVWQGIKEVGHSHLAMAVGADPDEFEQKMYDMQQKLSQLGARRPSSKKPLV